MNITVLCLYGIQWGPGWPMTRAPAWKINSNSNKNTDRLYHCNKLDRRTVLLRYLNDKHCSREKWQFFFQKNFSKEKPFLCAQGKQQWAVKRIDCQGLKWQFSLMFMKGRF